MADKFPPPRLREQDNPTTEDSSVTLWPLRSERTTVSSARGTTPATGDGLREGDGGVSLDVANGLAVSTGGPPVDWPRAILELTTAAAEGAQTLAVAAVQTARVVGGGESSALVRWFEGRPRILAQSGVALPSLHTRPAEGATFVASRPSAVVMVDPRTDLIVSRSEGPRFDESDVDGLRALAALLSWAGERIGSPLSLLRGLATRVVASLELDEVLVSVADAVSRLLRAEIAGVLLLAPSGDELEMRCAVGNRTLDTARLRIRRGQGLAGRVLATGSPARVDDYCTDPGFGKEFLPVADAEGTCSALAVPLLRDRRVVGVLCAWRRRRAPFTEEDESALEAFAELSVVAIQNATTHQELLASEAQVRSDYECLEERSRSAEQEARVRAELTRIAVEGGDLAAVMRTACLLTQASAAVVGDDGRLLAIYQCGAATGHGDRLQQWVRRNTAGSPLERSQAQSEGASGAITVEQDGQRWMLVAPVQAMGLSFGYLALGLDAPPTAIDRLAAEQAAVVSALRLAREEAALASARRLQSEFVWDLLDGRLPDAVEARVRARHLGHGFRLPARVAVVEVSDLPERVTSEGWNPEQIDQARAQLGRLILHQLEQARTRGAILARRADLFAVVVPGRRGEPVDASRTLASVLASGPWPSGLTVAVGVGGLVEHMSRFPDGWREALLARSAAVPGAPGVFEDLGVLQFLLAPTSRTELDRFAHQQLGPLLAYDDQHGSALVATLQTYLATDCSARRAAEAMFVHYRTVCYRLQRVEELTGLKLERQEDRFRAQLAIKILGLGQAGAAAVDDAPSSGAQAAPKGGTPSPVFRTGIG